MGTKMREGFERDDVRKVLDEIFRGDIHAKRVLSLANATTGVLAAGSLAVSAIGQGLAHVCGLDPKHTVKQVDRLLGNAKVDVWEYFTYWVPYLVGERKKIIVALDWTDFDRDKQSTIALNLLTSHGRAIPLVWRTVRKSDLKDNRNRFEDSVLRRLRETLPDGVAVTVVADRGFMDTNLFEVMRDSWGFDYVVRLRGNVTVTDAKGEKRVAAEWVGQGGRARTLRKAKLTNKGFPVPTVVCVQDKAMKDSWCLATSIETADGRDIVAKYGRRFECEESFRDLKDWRFGLALKYTKISSKLRRERLLFAFALAAYLLTLVGVVSEKLGCDRLLRANTVQYRTHSLFRQGREIARGALPDVLERECMEAVKQRLSAALSKGFCHALS